ITNVPANWKPNMTIEGDSVVSSAGAYTADFTVLSGATLKHTGNDTAGEGYDAAASRTITVQDGGTFDINGHEAYYHIILEGGSKLANSGGAVGPGARNLALVELTGNATVDTDTRLGVVFSGYAASELHLNGNTLTKTGSGTFHINNCTTDSGTIRIEEGTVHWLEYHGPATTTTDATTFVVCGNEDGSVKGTLEFGTEGRTVGAIAGLVADGGIVNVGGSRKVTILDSLTGSAFTKKGTGSLALQSGMTIANDIEVTVEDGTIVLSSVGIETGKSLTINGAVVADNLCKTGEGSLTIGSLSGTVILKSLTSNSLIETLSGETLFDVLSLSDQLSSGVQLGVKYTESNLANIQMLSLADGTWELVNDDGYIKLQGKNGSDIQVDTEWDINWSTELANAPATVTQQVAATGNVSLNLVATEITGGGDASTIVAGASALGRVNDVPESAVELTGDTWLKVSGGTFDRIVGGISNNNWNNPGNTTLTGDTHVVMTGGTTNHIIGGLNNDADTDGGPAMTGNTYLSVFEGATVSGSVVGGSTVSHNRGTSLTGDTNVFIYTALSGAGNVMGGHYFMANTIGSMNLTGSTNVTIDLSKYSAATGTFEKNIIGGSYTGGDNGLTTSQSGDTHVTIIGKSGVTFSGAVAGGNMITKGNTVTIGGSTNVNISGDSTFSGVISGGNNFSAWSGWPVSNIAATNVDISGGTFNEKVIGGDALVADGQMKSTVGDVTMAISGGTYNANIIGGSFKGTNGGGGQIIRVGDVSVTLSGGSMAAGKTVMGGSMLTGTGSQSLGNSGNLSMGDISVTITGGSWQNVLGGTYVERNNSHYMSQGDIVVDLKGGTIAGDVYAAGQQVNSSYLTTESTTVKLAGAVILTAGKTVSGGYNTTKTNSTISGSRVLELIDSQDRSGINFKDFDAINVTTAGSIASIGSLTTSSAVTKTGAGTLTLAGDTNSVAGGLTVSEGGLATGCATTLGGALTLADGTALNVKDGVLTVDGALTLGTGLVLTTSELISGDNILISGITSSDITAPVAADTIFASINDLTGIDEFTVKVVDGNLVLTTFFTKEITWDAANSTWKVGSKFGSTDADTFANGDTAIFGALSDATEEVTIDGAVTAASVSIEAGADKTYSFISTNGGKLTTSTLVIGAGTAKFGEGTLDVAAITDLTVNGTLDLTTLGVVQANNVL
ncbi:MAG: autotransporter-associated beta strand repeat-containing protein, partial [Akkermansia sp.]|nr:autotransporter-associated beta strand repeat-containing protein [Akkermansia sp.]